MNRDQYFCERDPQAFPFWQKAVVGIAGAGGLGSNIALMLARAGIGTLIVADYDTVSISNLNRQAFDLSQVGMHKVTALQHNILRVNPFIELQMHHLRLIPENLPIIFAEAEIMIEALDNAEEKAMLIETWLQTFPQKPVICASGLAGYGRNEEIRTIQDQNLYVIGDMHTQPTEGIAPIAPRVMIVAAMQANLCLELLTKDK
ncbi:MAG: sulfur carrier protein ThiS adenylyltransferase ThiF [Candidatus Cloacimonetes bacterium]|jgi:sulfur carrier protein ThiS adenylyltransferase|nr:sulfur carrier protein ThiS adenylyltransferase ThiF [Candidatus Cloacimonadota bacterium]MDD2506712.1 sulfur carrier protein ThiS adenylyltransferase ThiF [Candidatus Cloacimonadota bacterium]MDD4560303.1 sulfur carrier protein ThiS adenylyltransferase ThiF [Candidatus Cloacimonadota bacterium]